MIKNWQERTIGDVVAKLPAAAAIFKAQGIDFCCGGQRNLGTVIQEQGLDAAAIARSLDSAQANWEAKAGTMDFTVMTPAELTDYIESRHHTYLREALPAAARTLGTVLKAHGRNHPELFRVHSLYGRLRTELEQHLVKEETMLFPMLAEPDPAEAESMADLVSQIKQEHEAAGLVLKELRQLTCGYTPPADACPTFTRLLSELEALESDLFQHIHLESNILLVN
jgi:regulator of cell morphogenesis and NO signaling